MNNEDNGYTIYCPRCGAEMNSKSRYCMKCGYLNTEHAANESMKPYIKENSESYQVGAGNMMGGKTTIANNTGNKRFCFIINFSVYMLIMIISSIIFVGNGFDILVLRDSMFPIICVIVSVLFLYIYSIELIFMKCNRPWWNGFIPVYNMIVLCDVLYQKKWLGILTLIPFVGQIFMLIMFYSLGKRFKFSGLLTALFSIIFIPIIGFGTSSFDGRVMIDESNQKEIESNYRRKNMFLYIVVLFMMLGIGLLVWKNMDDVEKGGELLGNSYYSFAGKRIVKKTKQYIDDGNVTCKDSNYYENTGVYYFIYPDLGDYVYLPLYLQREPIEGYVKVDNSTGESKYYVSVTDGKKGFDETLIDELSGEKVKEFKKLKAIDKDEVNVCEVK